jgi:uncharacterized Zn-finger protein
MADPVIPHFCNDAGMDKIRIGVRELKCMGASPPYDHPHVFLEMGAEDQVICPYCSTVYLHDTKLGALESDPPGCRFEDSAAA